MYQADKFNKSSERPNTGKFLKSLRVQTPKINIISPKEKVMIKLSTQKQE